VDRALRALPGVRIDHLKVGAATISYDEASVTRERIAQAIEDAGYHVPQST
jgi:copper chaperone CopZ